MSNNSLIFRIVSDKGLIASDIASIFEFPQKNGFNVSSFNGRDERDINIGINEIIKGEVSRESPIFFSFHYDLYFSLSAVEEKDYISFIFNVHSKNLILPWNYPTNNSDKLFADFVVDFFSHICLILGEKCRQGFGDIEFVLEAHENNFTKGLGKYWLTYVPKGILVDGYHPSRGIPSPLPWYRIIATNHGKILVGERYPKWLDESR